MFKFKDLLDVVMRSPKKGSDRGLPMWRVGVHTFHARNERQAEKYAKLKGFWKEGAKVRKIG